ncbi:hypothetical protein CHISP_2244 [Chitinispirillum alkaliphilum]|nr:hypothetical protein CHISP_2244 [Chitinispirillum alkaliphilum]
MLKGAKHNSPCDIRIYLYKGLKQFAVIFAIGLTIKTFFLDSVVIEGNQMSPTLDRGDRVIYFKTPHILPGSLSQIPERGTPVLYRSPQDNVKNLLRVSSRSGERVHTQSGVFYIGDNPFTYSSNQSETIVPSRYSPRDFMEPYTVPSPGDTIHLHSLSIRDFFFAFSVLQQERPQEEFELGVNVFESETVVDEFIIENFSLYSGPISSVPEDLRHDWFFWERLGNHLEDSSPGQFELGFRVYDSESEAIDQFTVDNEYVFLIADNWQQGLDSRYFGPVNGKALKGRAFAILWASRYDTEGNRKLIKSRFGKLI